MDDERWNHDIQLYPTDRLFAAVFAPLFPSWVRPNHLTVLRLLLVPPVVAALGVERFGLGIALFLLAAFTDWFDGALARTRRQVTAWGILYDPIVDKLLIGSVLFVIVVQELSAALGAALLAAEVAGIAAAVWRGARGTIQPANRWGKAKMVAEVLGVVLLLLAAMTGIGALVPTAVAILVMALMLALINAYVRLR